MRSKFYFASLFVIFNMSCSKQDFSGSAASTQKKKENPNSDSRITPIDSQDIPVNPDIMKPEDGGSINEAVKCSEGRVSYITSVKPAGESCPPNSTVFAADDGSALQMACCALPKVDILLASHVPEVRGTSCGPDELAVGAKGMLVVCQKIDTTKYKLGTRVNACYYGSGSSGSSGAGPCKAPNTFLNAVGTRFGSDGCVAAPGSVVYGREGKTCGQIPVRTLLSIDGTPVAFPY